VGGITSKILSFLGAISGYQLGYYIASNAELEMTPKNLKNTFNKDTWLNIEKSYMLTKLVYLQREAMLAFIINRKSNCTYLEVTQLEKLIKRAENLNYNFTSKDFLTVFRFQKYILNNENIFNKLCLNKEQNDCFNKEYEQCKHHLNHFKDASWGDCVRFMRCLNNDTKS
jgi:hypothetical protein